MSACTQADGFNTRCDYSSLGFSSRIIIDYLTKTRLHFPGRYVSAMIHRWSSRENIRVYLENINNLFSSYAGVILPVCVQLVADRFAHFLSNEVASLQVVRVESHVDACVQQLTMTETEVTV